MEKVITPDLEEKIKGAETLDDLAKVCAEAGIDVTKEQLEAELAKEESDELDETALDDVAGGASVLRLALGAIVVIWKKVYSVKRSRGGGGRGSFGGGGGGGGGR
ncbi:MAG: hypothetical protein IJN67_00455 [Oscillospiraceae bacterium]|nr:hypothetical protein [Oscillospiraceae bacterium]